MCAAKRPIGVLLPSRSWNNSSFQRGPKKLDHLSCLDLSIFSTRILQKSFCQSASCRLSFLLQRQHFTHHHTFLRQLRHNRSQPSTAANQKARLPQHPFTALHLFHSSFLAPTISFNFLSSNHTSPHSEHDILPSYRSASSSFVISPPLEQSILLELWNSITCS